MRPTWILLLFLASLSLATNEANRRASVLMPESPSFVQVREQVKKAINTGASEVPLAKSAETVGAHAQNVINKQKQQLQLEEARIEQERMRFREIRRLSDLEKEAQEKEEHEKMRFSEMKKIQARLEAGQELTPESYAWFDVCANMPCKNGGQCTKTGWNGYGFTTYTCDCASNWAGADCSIHYEKEVAKGQPASQSSDYANTATAKNAVDGNTDGNYFHGSVSATLRGTNPWWRVDLGKRYIVKDVAVYSRTDCCQNELIPARVIVGDQGDSWEDKLNKKLGDIDGLRDVYHVSSSPALSGRFVWVQSPGDNRILVLAEVRVFADEDDCTDAAKASCKNGGKCVDGVNMYTCDCQGTGFAGKFCEDFALSVTWRVSGTSTVLVDSKPVAEQKGATSVQRAADLSAKTGSVLEIHGNHEGGLANMIATVQFRGETMSTDAGWECSSNNGQSWSAATILGPNGKVAKYPAMTFAAQIPDSANHVWCSANVDTGTNKASCWCRLLLPKKVFKANDRVVFSFKNRVPALCSQGDVVTTRFFGTICANGNVLWDHGYTLKDDSNTYRPKPTSSSICAWQKSSVSVDIFGDCDHPPAAIPDFPVPRASFFAASYALAKEPLALELNPCADNRGMGPCDANSVCTWNKQGPMPVTCTCANGYSNQDVLTCKPIDACVESPCDPNAVCTNLGPGKRSCQCKAGYYGSGEKCEVNDRCAKNPCDTHATCTNTGPGTFKCTCLSGFEGNGLLCREIDGCKDHPCSPFATCTKTGPGTKQCKCNDGYEGNGVVCTEIDACAAKVNPCGDHALCTKTGPGLFSCACRQGYETGADGKVCQEIDMCSRKVKPCHQFATCFKTVPGEFRCECNAGYEGTGFFCEESNACLKLNPCPPHTSCAKTGPGTFKCTCDDGYRLSKDGKVCEEIDQCAETKPCDPHATCAKTGPGTFSCQCLPNYEGNGRSCTPVNACLRNPCSRFGSCTSLGPGQFTCQCNTGYEGNGVVCEERDMCKYNPCDAHATCAKTGPGTYVCNCIKDYTMDSVKKVCVEIDPCLNPHACHPNAACTKTGPNQHTCACNPGYVGDGFQCEEYDKCTEHPCDLHAACTKTGPGTFKCDCHSCYQGTGQKCEVANECLTNKTCSAFSDCTPIGPCQRSCKCWPGYRGPGTYCEEIDPCESNPCHFNAICKKTGPGRNTCTCKLGYVFAADGKTCVEEDKCQASDPVCDKNAKCIKTGPGAYRCECMPGYAGMGYRKVLSGWVPAGAKEEKCTAIDNCALPVKPCDVNADCVKTGPGTNICSCHPGYIGDGTPFKCIEVDHCADRPRVCDDHAWCKKLGPGKYSCECMQFYQGNGDPGKCEEIDPCVSDPCHIHATCTKTAPGHYKCECNKNEGYAGDGFVCHLAPVMPSAEQEKDTQQKADIHDTAMDIIKVQKVVDQREQDDMVALSEARIKGLQGDLDRVTQLRQQQASS